MDGQVIRDSGPRAVVAFCACLLAIACCGCRPDRETVQRALFATADSDDDGSLTADEFARSLPPDHSPEDAADEFSSADENQDHQLSFDEYVSTLPKPHWLLWTIGVFSAISFVGSLIAIPIVVARLPVDHFVAPHEAADWLASSIGRRLWLVLKNFLGLLLIIGGIIMLVLPGQGILTLLLGVAMMDLPGKWKLMRALARRPNVMKALNWMRERAEKPPLTPPPPKGSTHHEISQLPPR